MAMTPRLLRRRRPKTTPAAITAAHTYIRKHAGPDTDLMLAMVLGVPQNGATT